MYGNMTKIYGTTKMTLRSIKTFIINFSYLNHGRNINIYLMSTRKKEKYN